MGESNQAVPHFGVGIWKEVAHDDSHRPLRQLFAALVVIPGSDLHQVVLAEMIAALLNEEGQRNRE